MGKGTYPHVFCNDASNMNKILKKISKTNHCFNDLLNTPFCLEDYSFGQKHILYLIAKVYTKIQFCMIIPTFCC